MAVGGMVGCIAHSLVRLIQLFFPSWSGTFVVVGCVVAAVEANYSYRLIRSRRLRGSDLLRFRAVELALFLMLLRVGAYVGDAWAEVVGDVLSWPQHPGRVFDLEVLFAFLLVLLSWFESTKATDDMRRIGEPPIRDASYVPPADALVSRFLWGGALLLGTTGVTRIGISDLLNLRRPSVPGLIGNVLIYFTLWLLMLGQIQFARLSERWRKEGLDVPAALTSHWVRYTLILLGLAGLIAYILPTAYTWPLLDVAAIVVGTALYVANVILQVMLLAFSLLLTPLAGLLGLGGEVGSRQRPDPIPPLDFPSMTPVRSAPDWLEIARALAFWAFGLVVVWYTVRSYLRDRPGLSASLKRFRPLRAARQVLGTLWRQLARLVAAIRRKTNRWRAEGGLGAGGRPGADGLLSDRDPFRFFRLAALSRRERTVYYYLSILRRAARHGFPRGQSQTPYEYDNDLGPNVPEVEEELDSLTDAFVEARYSTHEIDEEREGRVRANWKKIRTALRSLRQRPKPNEKTDRS
jgi:hypothetical protein